MSSSTSNSDARASGSSSAATPSARAPQAAMPHKSGADVDLDALGGGDAAASGKRGGKGARLFLMSMAAGLAACAGLASVAPESWIHTPPEYGMAEAFEDHITAACTAKAAPDLLIIGDSRAVAGLSAQDLGKTGLSIEKFALGGSGIFTGWAVLDRLVDCGVRPKSVVMAYGPVHILDTGAMMERTTNYDLLKGPRAGHAFDMASQWEASAFRRAAYKAVSILGPELTGVDLVLAQPALKNVLEKPPVAFYNQMRNEEERASFLAHAGDRFYGLGPYNTELPDERIYAADKTVPRINREASAAIAELGRTHGFDVSFYFLPIGESGKAGLPPQLFDTVEAFRQDLEPMGIRPLNAVWTLPDTNFGDPSHVNARGRDAITADFLARLAAG